MATQQTKTTWTNVRGKDDAGTYSVLRGTLTGKRGDYDVIISRRTLWISSTSGNHFTDTTGDIHVFSRTTGEFVGRGYTAALTNDEGDSIDRAERIIRDFESGLTFSAEVAAEEQRKQDS